MKFNKSDMRFFEMARREALKSDFKAQHIGAVLVYKKKVIGVGHNTHKTSPRQKRYNQYRKFNGDGNNYVKHSCHAEMSALQSVSFVTGKEIDWRKVSIYIFRICPGKRLGYGLSFPCEACERALRDFNIRNVFHTTDSGFAYLRLE